MRIKIRITLALIGSLFLLNAAQAQVDQSSYSSIGLGSLNWGGYSHNNAMGGMGLTYNSRFFMNNLNPAMVATNYEAVFQSGLSVDFRQFSNNTESYSSNTGGFKDFGLALPLKAGKWNLGLQLSPYTTVNYGFSSVNENGGPEGSNINTQVTGNGGLDKLAATNAFRIKNFRIGLETALIFGSIEKEDLFQLDQGDNSLLGITAVGTRRSYSSISTNLGVVYKLPVGENKWVNMGGYYNPEFNLRQNSLVTLENRDINDNVVNADTLVDDKSLKRTVGIPARLGFGISYESFQKLALGIDFHYQDWSDYRNENDQAIGAYGSSFKLAIGGEFIPDFKTTKFVNVISYRFGVHFERTPFVVNNESVNDFGINFGASLPLSAVWGLSYMNLGVTFGQRGNVTNGLVRESYVKLHIGFNIQDFTWFARQRFN